MSGYIGEQRQVFITDSLTRSQVENAEFDFNNMPTVGGDPIVESGSNSDGEWTRWADGSQRCISPDFAVDIDSVSGNIFKGTTFPVWTFPIAFVVAPYCDAVTRDNSTTWANAASITATTTQVRFYPFSSSSNTANAVSGSAHGRWK